MIRDLLVWSGKILLNMVVWIFILSFEWKGRSLYDRGYDILVDNEVVEAFDREIYDLWERVKKTALVTFAKLSTQKKDQEKSF